MTDYVHHLYSLLFYIELTNSNHCHHFFFTSVTGFVRRVITHADEAHYNNRIEIKKMWYHDSVNETALHSSHNV